MMNPFDQAWGLLKSSSFTKPSEVRAGEAGGSLGEYQPSRGKAWTHPSNVYAQHKKLYPFGKLNEAALINEIVGTDVHESVHEAMHNVGETYDSGLHEEYAPNLAQILTQARMPGIYGGNTNQVMRLIHGNKERGIEPRPDTQAAMDYTKEYANSFGFNHPKVRKPTEEDGKLLTYAQTKPEFYTGYGKDLE